MRRRFSILAAVAFAVTLTFGVASIASANEGPHGTYAPIVAGGAQATALSWQDTDKCALCHRAHTGQNADLLAYPSAAQLCKTCHTLGIGATTDVFNGQQFASFGTTQATSSSNPALNGGGFVQAMNNYSGSYGTVTSKHVVEGLDAGGGTFTDGIGTAFGGGNPNSAVKGVQGTLECGSCHNPHGSSNYRLLKGFVNYAGKAQTWTPGETATYQTNNVGTTPNELNVTMVGAQAVSTHNYTAGTNVVYDRGMSDFCATCHTNYLQDFAGGRTDTTGTPGVGQREMVQYNFDGSGAKNVWRHAVSFKAAWNYSLATPGWDTSQAILQHFPYTFKSAPTTPTYPTTTPVLREVNGDLGAEIVGSTVVSSGASAGTYVNQSPSLTGDANGYNNGGALTCLTCHNAHGSSAATTSTTVNEEIGTGTGEVGDSALLFLDNRGVCQTCHKKGTGN